VYETEAAVCVTVELAGVEQDDLEVLLFEDALVVEGARRPVLCAPGGVYHSAEIRHGPFRLELPLPVAVDGDSGPEARYERGLLHITLPKLKSAA
jgi:HSP20 family protein